MYRAIIVDDEPRMIEALERNIDWKRCGIQKVYSAMNMSAAIKIIVEQQVEVLVCDIEMPNGSGLQLLEWLKKKNYNLSCIFVTCHQEYQIMREAMQLRCYDYILKPIDYKEFTVLLSEMVEKMEHWEKDAEVLKKYNWGALMERNVAEKEKARAGDIESEVKSYIRNHLSENITIEGIAGYCHFSASYMMKIFKEKTGVSIGEYIAQARIKKAQKILKTTRIPIKEVAELVGYGDSVYFTKIFHREVGVTPSEYRRNLLN